MALTAARRKGPAGSGRAAWWWLLTVPLAGAAVVTTLLPAGGSDVPVRAAGDPEPATPAEGASERREQPAAPSEPTSYWRTDGQRPEAHPDDRAGVGFVGFGADLDAVTDVLGPPDHQHVEAQAIVMGDTLVNRWELDRAELVVQALPEDRRPVEFIRLSLGDGSAVRASLWGGVVAGESTLADVVAAWGDDHDRRVLPAHPEQWAAADEPVDAYRHTLVWPACAGDVPLLIGVGHQLPAPGGAVVGDVLPDFDPAALEAPVTEVWVAWADAEPAHHGCA